MIPGTTVTIGAKKFLMPPMNIKTMKLHKPMLIKIMKGAMGESSPDEMVTLFEESFDKFSDIILATLKRNYPELTLDLLEEDLDLGNIQDLMMTVMKTSGFEATIKEDAPTGGA